MIGLFTVFKVMKPQENYMEELYGLGEYKLTLMLVVPFPADECKLLYIWAP